MLFNGANGAEHRPSANGGRLRFFRDTGNITMDTDEVETVDFKALGGADVVTVNDLTGTDVTKVDLDLAAGLGGGAGDGAADHVTVNGTTGDDTVRGERSANGVTVTGLSAQVAVLSRAGRRARRERRSAATTPFGRRARRGHRTHARRRRRRRPDRRWAGRREVDRRRRRRLDRRQRWGTSPLWMGAATTRSCGIRATAATLSRAKTVTTRCVFNGANDGEKVNLSANGSRLNFFRNPVNITMDINGVETPSSTPWAARQNQGQRPHRHRRHPGRPRPRRRTRRRSRRQPGRPGDRQRHRR